MNVNFVPHKRESPKNQPKHPKNSTQNLTIENLPQELLLKIFTSLNSINAVSAVRATNRRWNRLCENKIIYDKFLIGISIGHNATSPCISEFYFERHGRKITPTKILDSFENFFIALYENNDLVRHNIKTKERLILSLKKTVSWITTSQTHLLVLTKENIVQFFNKLSPKPTLFHFDLKKFTLKTIEQGNLFIWNHLLIILENKISEKIVIQIDRDSEKKIQLGRDVSAIELIEDKLIVEQPNSVSIWDLTKQKWHIEKRVVKCISKAFNDSNSSYLLLLEQNYPTILNINSLEQRILKHKINNFSEFNPRSKLFISTSKRESLVKRVHHHGYREEGPFATTYNETIYCVCLTVFDIFRNSHITIEFPLNANIHSSDQIEIINNYIFFRSRDSIRQSSVWKYYGRFKQDDIIEKVCELSGPWTHLHTGKYFRIKNNFFDRKAIEVVDFTDATRVKTQKNLECSII